MFELDADDEDLLLDSLQWDQDSSFPNNHNERSSSETGSLHNNKKQSVHNQPSVRSGASGLQLQQDVTSPRERNHQSDSLDFRSDQESSNKKMPARKFPGPAGALPSVAPATLSRIDGALGLFSPVINSNGERDVKEQEDMPLSQSQVDIGSTAEWKAMVEDLGTEATSVLAKFSIKAMLIKASRRMLPRGKVPLLLAMVENLDVQGVDASVVLKDSSGKMNGSLHRDLIKDPTTAIQVGTVMVLRQVSVISPSSRTHYLNITPSNVALTYTTINKGSKSTCRVVKHSFASKGSSPSLEEHTTNSPSVTSVSSNSLDGPVSHQTPVLQDIISECEIELKEWRRNEPVRATRHGGGQDHEPNGRHQGLPRNFPTNSSGVQGSLFRTPFTEVQSVKNSVNQFPNRVGVVNSMGTSTFSLHQSPRTANQSNVISRHEPSKNFTNGGINSDFTKRGSTLGQSYNDNHTGSSSTSFKLNFSNVDTVKESSSIIEDSFLDGEDDDEFLKLCESLPSVDNIHMGHSTAGSNYRPALSFLSTSPNGVTSSVTASPTKRFTFKRSATSSESPQHPPAKRVSEGRSNTSDSTSIPHPATDLSHQSLSDSNSATSLTGNINSTGENSKSGCNTKEQTLFPPNIGPCDIRHFSDESKSIPGSANVGSVHHQKERPEVKASADDTSRPSLLQRDPKVQLGVGSVPNGSVEADGDGGATFWDGDLDDDLLLSQVF